MYLFSSSTHNVANKLAQIVIFLSIVAIDFVEELAVAFLLDKNKKTLTFRAKMKPYKNNHDDH